MDKDSFTTKIGTLNTENKGELSSSSTSRKQSEITNDQNKKVQDKKEPEYQNYNDQPVYASKYTDSDNSEDEGMEDYKVGGYHPVHVGYVNF